VVKLDETIMTQSKTPTFVDNELMPLLIKLKAAERKLMAAENSLVIAKKKKDEAFAEKTEVLRQLRSALGEEPKPIQTPKAGGEKRAVTVRGRGNQIVSYLREFPGSTARQIAIDLYKSNGERVRTNVASMLSYLRDKGRVISKDGLFEVAPTTQAPPTKEDKAQEYNAILSMIGANPGMGIPQLAMKLYGNHDRYHMQKLSGIMGKLYKQGKLQRLRVGRYVLSAAPVNSTPLEEPQTEPDPVLSSP
jgi:hypothetical protein